MQYSVLLYKVCQHSILERLRYIATHLATTLCIRTYLAPLAAVAGRAGAGRAGHQAAVAQVLALFHPAVHAAEGPERLAAAGPGAGTRGGVRGCAQLPNPARPALAVIRSHAVPVYTAGVGDTPVAVLARPAEPADALPRVRAGAVLRAAARGAHCNVAQLAPPTGLAPTVQRGDTASVHTARPHLQHNKC